MFINDLPGVLRNAATILCVSDLKLSEDLKLLIVLIIGWSYRLTLMLYLHGLKSGYYRSACSSLISYFHVEYHLQTMHISIAFEIKVLSYIEDLGVTFNNSLNFRSRYKVKCKKANILCSLIFKSFVNRSPVILIFFINTYVRPILDYSSPIWFPHLLINILFIE